MKPGIWKGISTSGAQHPWLRFASTERHQPSAREVLLEDSEADQSQLMPRKRHFPASAALLAFCTGISSPGPSEQAVPPSVPAPGCSSPALAAVGRDAAEPLAPRRGIASAPSISSRHQFHVGSSNKRSIVLNTKTPNFFIVCYLKRDFSWSKPIVLCPVPPEKHCPTGNPAPGISWQRRSSGTPLKSKRRLVPACLKHTSSKIPFILGLGCCGEKA